jgi:glycosyltransferase involved in cell wall biosynthesis
MARRSLCTSDAEGMVSLSGTAPRRSSRPGISVITVVYNGSDAIENAILSVAEQTYPRVEHIIIDGGSNDGTMDVIHRHRAKIAVVRSGPDRGMYDAMNKGLSLATGEIIGFLNADDVYADPRVLGDIVRVLQAEQADACYGDLVYVDKLDGQSVVRYWKSQPYRDGLFEKGWMPAHPTFYVRRWVYEKYGGFDLAYRRQSDFELTMRFLEIHKCKTVYIPKVLIRMRSGGASQGLWHILAGNYESYLACKKHQLKVSPLFMVKKILSRVPQLFRRQHNEV